MLQNAYLLAKIGADTAENEQHFARRRRARCAGVAGLPREQRAAGRRRGRRAAGSAAAARRCVGMNP